jgi:hypothetical protein
VYRFLGILSTRWARNNGLVSLLKEGQSTTRAS